MIYLSISKLVPVYGQIVQNCKYVLCTVSKNFKSRPLFNRYNSTLKQTNKPEQHNAKSNSQDKDKLLFYYEKPRYYNMINAFGFIQFFFWLHLAELTVSKGDKLKMETNEFSPWWKKLDMENKNTRKMVSTFCFLLGFGVLSVSWIYTLRSVRMLVFRKDKKHVTFVTYGPFGKNHHMDVPLENITTNVSREFAKSQLPIKVKGKWFYYILDMKEGKFQNPELFDRTAGLKRVFK